jgi:DNA-binding NtrC family response regulator
VSRTTQDSAPSQPSSTSDIQQSKQTVLIVSLDTVGPALVGGLVETLGYRVSFNRRGERIADALRRERPGLVLIDASDPQMSAETLGHSRMLGVSVIVFGASDAVERACAVFADRRLATLVMPLRTEAVEEALKKSLADG